MSELFFWNECKKTLERDLPLEEYSTWISPLLLRENVGTSPKSYSILAPNKFILDWVEENYGESIKDRISAITSNIELNLNFEVFEDSSFEERPRPITNNTQSPKNPTKTTQDEETNLIPDFTFSTFVEGKSNHIALAASKQVASGLQNSYNPLFIYGGVGLGKTHLMHAVGNLIKQQNPEKLGPTL